MWIESFWHYENPWVNEQKESLNYDLSSLTDSQNRIESEARNYVLKEQSRGRNVTDLVQNLTPMMEKQRGENESLENQIQSETIEWLDKEAMVNEVKIMMYEKLWISNSMWDNNWGENFWKWLVDTLVLDNYDLAIQTWETNGVIIIDGIKELFSSWENLQKIAEALWESIMWLFSLDGYETWKSIADLWLIWSWVWAWIMVWKKTIKLGVKQILKLKNKAERVVESFNAKKIIWEVNDQVNEILPKQEIDIDVLVKRRVDIERQVKWLENLWIPESFSKDMLGSWLMKEKFFWWDLLKRFEALNNKWIDINWKIDEVIKNIPSLTREEALLIFSYTDKTIFEKLNGFMRGDKNIIDNMTKENIETSIKLISNLEDALEKMPDLKWDLILRWDDWRWWLTEWSDIPLKAFTSVSNNKSDIFLWELYWNNILVEIIWKQWRVKDISSLAMFVQFAKKLWRTTTINEWVILPNSVVQFVSKEIKKMNLPNIDWDITSQKIIEAVVEQMK